MQSRKTVCDAHAVSVLTFVFLVALFGCAPSQIASDQQTPTTFALMDYSPEFSQAVARELQTAAPELKQTIKDYVKLRCAIKPQMQICKDLQK